MLQSMSFHEESQRILPELIELRRRLHQHPEVGLHLPQTQQAVLEALAGLPLEITLGKELSSVVAVLHGDQPGPTVLLRGDMDALPVLEETGLPYASVNGNMHACGHDLHTAGLVGAAKLLAAQKSQLSGAVVFMFQPGEEGPGGAQPMLDEGLLAAAGQAPVAAYAIHVVPGPRGVFLHRTGAMLAGSSTVNIRVHGEGGHGSQPFKAKDPVPALVKIAGSLQEMVASKFPTFDPVVLTVTQLRAGKAVNVIPDTAELGATARTLSAESIERLRTHVPTLAEGIAASFGCTAEIDIYVDYPVTINDRAETSFAARTLGDHFGAEFVQQQAEPRMGAEDFSLVLEEVPGSMLFLGASPEHIDPDTAPFNHSPKVLFDDAVLADQASALALLAFHRTGSLTHRSEASA